MRIAIVFKFEQQEVGTSDAIKNTRTVPGHQL